MQNHHKSCIFSFFGLQPKILNLMLKMYLFHIQESELTVIPVGFLSGSYVHVSINTKNDVFTTS